MADNEFGRFKELKKESSKGQELFGKTLGVIGFGRIGRETARIAIGSGMNVVGHDPYMESAEVELKFHPDFNMKSIMVPVPMVSKDELLKQSHFVTLHMPGGGKPVIGAEEIKIMKKGAVLVNCARGGVVDEKAMSEALSAGHLSAVGLDVFEKEPPVNMDFFTRDDVSLSPHIGAATSEAQERIGEELAKKIIAHFN